MALAEDTVVYVSYDLPGPPLWHERRILAACACGRGWHIVLTPDLDMYPEQLSLENTDLSEFRVAPAGDLPFGVHAGNSYRFRGDPGALQMEQLRRDAALAAAALAFPPGAGLGLAAPPPAQAGGAGGAAAAVDPDTWVYVETDTQYGRGATVILDGTEVLRGTVGLKQDGGEWRCIRNLGRQDATAYKGREAACDARLMGITFQDQKRDERTWREVSTELKEEKFEDWAVPGPRTSTWCSRFLNRRNGGPIDHHRWWVSTHQLKPDSWGVAEHESLLKIVDKLGRYDGLDLSNIAGAELAFRRLQLIEYFYSERGPGSGKGAGKSKPEKAQADETLYRMESSIFSGTHREFGDTMVCPELMEFVSKEVEREASIMKQVRKAREERAAASK